ncbi:bifunctional diaminohydroxyphosphoribosylaminopyrimidine deaminase/5-amino-6-(5-phosphoribosylamino)uracil reductase RibD [Anderseniella sp. Alg231-50]|uniref:bifunctional diaminohydroxyphosphoribosylaminopyrimidine deaminase/5-amino-6-(5-phosphoribosylamino)uracil reductase RibD n=1 Tax=Anderseniella sp. Alg231-50 TaxID=1922226 RepID=UPI000D560AF1
MSDEIYMRQAVAAGRRQRGSTGENPSVGCVIVSDGATVAVASTAPGGRPHAETQALAMAGEAARGATAFVTLEPCCHHGRTPPCVDALIEAGIARVVTALDDPDPRVSGGGHNALLDAGIDVTQGVLADQVNWELRAFLKRHIEKRAYVTLKLAVSADGKIAAKPGEPTAITGEAARDRVHLLRAEVDAILVGVSTVLADDPDLTCRLPGMADRSPVRIVSDSKLSIPLTSRLVGSANDVPLWIMTTSACAPDTRSALEARGVQVIECGATVDGKVDLDDMLVKLADRGVSHVLAEGGAHMARALVEADLVDEAVLLQAPKKVGPQGLAAMAGLPLDTIRASAGFRQRGESESLGADWLAKYVRVR